MLFFQQDARVFSRSPQELRRALLSWSSFTARPGFVTFFSALSAPSAVKKTFALSSISRLPGTPFRKAFPKQILDSAPRRPDSPPVPGKILCLDCDSTLSTIEGIDELARLAGPGAFAEVQALTRAAMDGEVPVEEVFARRLDLIRPSREDCRKVGRLYCRTLVPGVEETLDAIRRQGWEPVIISGGFTQCIDPLAEKLGIETLLAVPLRFHADGSYAGFDESAPTARDRGKPDCIARLKADRHPEKIAMAGDGASDLETAPFVDRFIGFGGVVARDRVEREAPFFTRDFREIPALLPA